MDIILAQFLTAFLLAWVFFHSLKKWTLLTITLLGIFSLPLLVIAFYFSNSSSLWESIGSSYLSLATYFFKTLADLTKTIPALTIGALLGMAYGFGYRIKI